ncbi:MAG: type II toxin-antitoxin system HicA family toxin [Candidatus Aenigmarchaeota archaeon]|nr:type II toxin-antitoxin system HicA family toxin [Candidatus Aenigmarchaeota archaeon]
MPKLPILSGHDVIKVLTRVGWQQKRTHGSHSILIKFLDNQKVAVVVPLHREIDKGMLLEIIRQSRLKRDNS